MVYYFSGTGNSRWVAERLAEAAEDRLCDMAACLRGQRIPPAVSGTETAGFVFPIHGWYAPERVRAFLSAWRMPHTNYRYAVCTCGDDVGRGMSRLSKHFPLDAAWSVTMPNTYIPMFSLDSDALCRQKIAEARTRIAGIARSVQRRERVWDVHEGSVPWLKTYIANPLFVRFIIRSKGFHVEEGCTGCGVCAHSCPVGNIRLEDDRPVWNSHCIHCMACVHGCPQKAIQYGKTTQRKGRYRLKDYL